MPHCRFCGEEAEFVRSHIIPEAFWRELRIDGKAPHIISSKPGRHCEKAPIGVYDCELLCDSCEKRFNPVDTYGIDVLLRQFNNYFLANKSIGYEGPEVNKARLLEFLVSILWRAAASNRDFFHKVKLGPHELAAKDSLFASPTAVSPVFDAVLFRWQEDQSLASAILSPCREKWTEGINAYRLYLGKVVACIKVDQRSFIEPLASCSLQAPGPCVLVTRELTSSCELKLIKNTVFKSEINKQKHRATKRHG